MGLYLFFKLDLWCLLCWEDYRGSVLGILSGLLVCSVYQLEEKNQGNEEDCSDKHEDQFH